MAFYLNLVLTIALAVTLLGSLIWLLINGVKSREPGSTAEDRQVKGMVSTAILMLTSTFGLGLLALDRGDVSTGVFSFVAAAMLLGLAIVIQRRHTAAQLTRFDATGSAYVPPAENPFLSAGDAPADRA